MYLFYFRNININNSTINYYSPLYTQLYTFYDWFFTHLIIDIHKSTQIQNFILKVKKMYLLIENIQIINF